MKTRILLFSALTVLFIQCGKDQDPFLITENSVGKITKETKINQLDSIFSQDSVVSILPKESFIRQGGQVEIYEKGGAKLMLISPKVNGDPASKISNIQIFDNRYKTEKGLNLNSTFKDIKKDYTVSNTQSTMMSVVLSLAETDVYVTIDRSKLPENSRNDFSQKIEATSIPEDATFKYFMVGWEKDNVDN